MGEIFGSMWREPNEIYDSINSNYYELMNKILTYLELPNRQKDDRENLNILRWWEDHNLSNFKQNH